MRAIITTQKKFNALNVKAHQYCIDNIKGYNAEKWCNEITHPVDNRIAFVVEDKIVNCLSDSEKDEIVELTDDWFVNEEL